MSRDSRLPTGAVLAESERLSRTVHVGMLRRCNGAATVGGGLLHRFFDTHFIWEMIAALSQAVLLRSGAAHAALSIETEGEEAWRPSLRDSLIRRPFLTHLQTMRVLFELVDGRAALHAPSCLFAHCRDG